MTEEKAKREKEEPTRQQPEAKTAANPAEEGPQPAGASEAAPAGEPSGAETAAQAPGSSGEGTAPADGTGAEPLNAVQQLKDALEQVRQEAMANYDRFLRAQAEFENYKKRIQKEHLESIKYALSPLLKDLIGILDNLERALEHARQDQGEAAGAMASGIEMVIKQMNAVFEKFGVIRIKAVGLPFDPTLHEAMMVEETDQVPENQVLQEFQAGFTLHDRVIRPAMVSVARGAGGTQANGGAEGMEGNEETPR